MLKKFCFSVVTAVLLTGCTSYKDYYKLDEQYLQRRQLETKQFDTNDEERMLTAAAQVLQDLGFSIDESETRLGITTASKSAEASTFAEKAGSVLLYGGMFDIVGAMNANYDIEQKICVTLVKMKNTARGEYNVRTRFARMIWNSKKEVRVEKIGDAEI